MALSGPVIFLWFGLMAGPLGLGIIDLRFDSDMLRVLAELTLALVLFTDAAKADLGVLRANRGIPQRLLLIGLPLTLGLGFVFGMLIFEGVGIIELAILATMLAPTDAALGKPLLSHPKVPARIREGLNVESGLNDGMCVPILFVLLAIALKSKVGTEGILIAVGFVLQKIGIGLAVGLGFTYVAVLAGVGCNKRGWITESWRHVMVFALAMSCFGIAQAFKGSGFIAAFAGGILFSVLVPDKGDLLDAAEGAGDSMALATWVAFGSGVVGQVTGTFEWDIIAYSVLSLTVIRIVPVFLALAGTGMKTSHKLFIGWFGPRGLVSIVFGVIVLNRGLPNDERLALTVVCTVTLSVLAHGCTANPLAAALDRGKT